MIGRSTATDRLHRFIVVLMLVSRKGGNGAGPASAARPVAVRL